MRLLGICLASFSSGLCSTFSYYHTLLTFGFRLRRTNFPPTFNNIFSSIRRWSQCWVRPLLSPYASQTPSYTCSILDTLRQVQVPQDWWEPFFGGRCAVLEYAPGLGYRRYVPFHLLVVFHPSRLTTSIGSAPSYPFSLLLPPSSQIRIR